MNVLLTGGSGFIGTELLRQLLSSDQIDRIVNLDLIDSPVNDSKLCTVRADVRDPCIVKSPIAGDFEFCIHLAALCKEPGYEWEDYFETNDIGTKNTIALCEKLGIQRIVFTSTMMVYRAGEVRRTEESATAPDTAYGISKLLAERQLRTWEVGGVDRELKIIRPAVVFGENENGNFTRLYRSIKRGVFPYVGKSSTIKANVYVKELVSFIQFLLHQNTSETIYNLSFSEDNTIRRIVSEIKHVFGLRSIHPTLPLRPLLWLSYIFEALDNLGLRNAIHHRRIEKLYHSTDIYPANAFKEGYVFQYNLRTALEDWKASGDQNF